MYRVRVPKSIVIDATHLAHPYPSGVEEYTRALLPLLSQELVSAQAAVTWVGHQAEPPVPLPAGVHWISSPHRLFWSQRSLLALLNQLKPDLFFTPSGIPPLRYRGKTALTIHDLAVYADPASFTWGQRLRLHTLHLAAKRARTIIVPSQYTAQQVAEHWHLPSERVHVVPHGYTPLSDHPEVVQGLSTAPMFIFIGRIERKKNLQPVISGFAKVVASQEAQLVLAGRAGYGAAALHRYVRSLPDSVRSHIHFLDYITGEQKAWLYKYAAGGLIPSPYEGFGLPVIDCFASGVVPVCAQAGALPEVAADAALYVQADSPTDWDLHMLALLNGTTNRTELAEKGKQYLKRFNWEQAATQTAEALLVNE